MKKYNLSKDCENCYNCIYSDATYTDELIFIDCLLHGLDNLEVDHVCDEFIRDEIEY